MKTDPIIPELTAKYDTKRKHRQWVHAELDCINLPYEKTKGGTIYLARLTKNLDCANSEPCMICKQKMIQAGIRKVHFTFSNDEERIIYLLDEFHEREIVMMKHGKLLDCLDPLKTVGFYNSIREANSIRGGIK